MGGRALSVVAPKYWNELPEDIRNIELPLDIFKKKLKTHYLKQHIVEKKRNDCFFLNRIVLYKYVMSCYVSNKNMGRIAILMSLKINS